MLLMRQFSYPFGPWWECLLMVYDDLKVRLYVTLGSEMK
jgi:hypothetical protein